jgi:hypothetical protein
MEKRFHSKAYKDAGVSKEGRNMIQNSIQRRKIQGFQKKQDFIE